MSVNQLFQPTQLKRVFFFILFDILISIVTILLAYLLRFNFDIPIDFLESMFKMMLLFIPLKIIVFFFFKIYFIAWRFFGLSEYQRIMMAHFIAYMTFTLIFFLWSDYFSPFPRSVIIIDLFLSIFFISFLRISKRLYVENSKPIYQGKMLILGTNESATYIIKSALRGEIPYHPMALISDDKNTVGTYFSNVKVYDQLSIDSVIEKLAIDTVVIAEKLEQKELDTLFTKLNELGIDEIKIVQFFQDDKPALADLSIEDLLARKPKDLDLVSIANFIVGKVVMITGAGGSIGSELCRQVKLFGAKQMILVDHSEFNLYQILEELNDIHVIPVMQSVRHRESLEAIFKQYRPEIVIHAAAYKHVPLCESNIYEAIQNNIFGTKNVIDLSIEYGVRKLVLISTDKAVRPTNVMGTTKRVCELYASAVPSQNTEIVAVRFGNVLGSSGSVIPKFQSQIEKGEAITVTHPDITRYFMLIPEACQLVLQAGSIAKGGELFILDMGEPIKIVDLAKKMIELSGRDDIEIEFTGLRAGEKLYEELLINQADLKTEYDSILVSQDKVVDYDILSKQIDALKYGNELEMLKLIVPEFKHNIVIGK
ncbi:MAG: UDP-N-acetylglucosamine 4,6-dehydratase (EC [uncultured Sulfurovum sp.]|uniref:UDP-N-acetylglucosamine 4,6-dehydratase (EC) n=1 Tax=uncultured Sulfurovum sp. TaxID=269237 RepID=A0A6S6TGK1_9BACT|nr:MAG: UDP-N-acetylglucosamine 4,6-dehydratase (EC [uncultured Sulfurovum sp.]